MENFTAVDVILAAYCGGALLVSLYLIIEQIIWKFKQ